MGGSQGTHGQVVVNGDAKVFERIHHFQLPCFVWVIGGEKLKLID
jgi:hypothetical protein